MDKKTKKIVIEMLACVLLVVIDQVTKVMALSGLADGDIPIIKNVLELHFLKNTGAAWGMFPKATIIFAIFSTVVSAGIVYIIVKIPDEKHYLPLSILSVCILAGAIGNLIDRIFREYVIDFIYFKIIDFPVFNVADIYVSVSGVVLIIFLFTIYKDEEFLFLTPNKENKN